MKNLDIESLKSVFGDNRTHIALGKLTKLSVASDRSALRVDVSIFPELREIGATMTWDAVGPESGIFSFPQVDDLVLVAFADGNDDLAFVIKRLTSRTDKIPLRASEGDAVFRALSGKKAWITGDRINLSEGDDEPTEPLMLGDITMSLFSDILGLLKDLSTLLSTHKHVSAAPGVATSPPLEASQFVDFNGDFDNIKSSPVDDGAILSDIAFTEKGT